MSMLLRYIIQIIGSLVFMFTLSPKLTGVLISVVPIVGIGAQKYGIMFILLLEVISNNSSAFFQVILHRTQAKK